LSSQRLDKAQAVLQRKRQNEGFLHRTWEIALKRPLDGEGHRDFISRLDRGTSRLVVVGEVLTSQEYGISGKDDTAFARDLYRLILDREPSAGDAVAEWANFASTHGRGAALEAFCTADEVRLRFDREDSCDMIESASGTLLATFRRGEVLLTIGGDRAMSPLKVTQENRATVEAFLNLSGFDALATRIARHLGSPQQ